MTDRKNAGSSVGSTLLILTFSIATLTAFAVLAVLNADGENKLVKKNGEMLSAYYTADSRGEERLGEIDRALTELWNQSDSESEYYSLIGLKYGSSFHKEQKQLVLEEYVSQRLRLNIVLRIHPPSQDGSNYEIEAWNTEAKEETQGSKRLKVWMGED